MNCTNNFVYSPKAVFGAGAMCILAVSIAMRHLQPCKVHELHNFFIISFLTVL